MENGLVYKSLDNKALTTSVLVAEKFGKRHADVIRNIKSMILANAILRRLYVSDTYIDDQGKNRPLYIMNRDGFTLLAMGFAGRDALDFKIEYIDAFNKMEESLKRDSVLAPTPAPVPVTCGTMEEVKRELCKSVIRMNADDDLKLDAIRMLNNLHKTDRSTKRGIDMEVMLNEPEYLSATRALRRFKVYIKTVDFNAALVSMGYLDRRKTENGKKYVVLVREGREYGYNSDNPYVEGSSFPLYAVDKFKELLDIVYCYCDELERVKR